jgi:DNA repair exonuclease SbcCD ATPase subunit
MPAFLSLFTNSAPSSPASGRPDVMNNNKRPAEPRSRGNSPPTKRRPPERRPSAQDRVCIAIRAALSLISIDFRQYDAPASPPLSRKSSVSGLPANVPTGPSHKIDHYRPDKGDGLEKRLPNGLAQKAGDETVSRRESAGHALSPVSNGSGSSTPVHPAPPAPSMVPGSATPLSGRPQQEPAGRDGVPTILAIQRLKSRKQAIADEGKRSSDMQALLSAQQAEIKQFAKERAEMSEKLASLQGLPDKVSQLETQLKTHAPLSVDPKLLQGALERITELEKLKFIASRIGAVEVSSSKRAVEMKSVASLIADVATLKSWKEAQSAVDSEVGENVKTFIRDEVITKTAMGKKILQEDLVAAEARLDKRITEDHTRLDKLSSDLAVVNTFKRDMEALKLPRQLHDLREQVDVVAEKELATYKTVTKTVEDINLYIGPIMHEYDFTRTTLLERMKDLREDLRDHQALHKKDQKAMIASQANIEQKQDEYVTRLIALENKSSGDLRDLQELHKQDQEAMTASQAKITQEQAKFVTRLTALEKKSSSGAGSGFTKVGTEVADSLAPSDDTKQRLDQFDKNVQGVQASVEALQILTQQIPQLSKQLSIVGAVQGNMNLATDAQKIPEDMASRKALDQLATELRGFETDLAHLSRRVSQFATSGGPTQLQDPGEGSSNVLAQIAEVKSFAETINDALETAETTIAGHATKLDLLETDIPEIVQGAVDASTAMTSKDMEALGQKVNHCNQEIASLKQQLGQPQSSGLDKAQQAQLESVTQSAASLQEELSSLQAGLTQESTSREEDVRDVKQQLLLKADIVTVNNHKDQMHHTIRILQDQYNNISTDDLYQKMIHWFMKSYPTNMSTVVTQVTALQQDIETLQSLATQVASVQSLDFTSLTSLVSKAPEIITMVNSTTELHQLPKTWAKIEVACNDAKEAMTKAEAADANATQQAERVNQVNLLVTSLQKSLNNLNAADSRFAKSLDLRNLATQLEGLEKNLATEKQARILSTNELKVTAGIDQEQILELSTRVDRVDTRIDEMKPRIAKVEESALGLRTDVDVINHDYIEPNREFLGLLGSMFILVGELQRVVESLNQNSLATPLRIQWTNDLELEFPGQASNVSDPKPKGIKAKTKK